MYVSFSTFVASLGVRDADPSAFCQPFIQRTDSASKRRTIQDPTTLASDLAIEQSAQAFGDDMSDALDKIVDHKDVGLNLSLLLHPSLPPSSLLASSRLHHR